MRVFVTIAFLLGAVEFSVCAPRPSFETVDTENGKVTGHLSPKANDVWEYLGVPYAQPPLGELRFAAPKKYSTKGAYNASNFGYDCPQQAQRFTFPNFTPQAPQILSYFTGSAGSLRSEDCLTLNIWSKETPKSHKSQKPVFVFFHGGRFAGGNTNTPFENGQYLASTQDLIVVTVNYRLNVFGFPGAPNLESNLGLRDQRLAVEWLQSNIAAFGGDPKKITIAGQSSGGVSVDWWSYAYTANPIVAGLISTSGTAFSFPLNPAQRQRENWYTLSSSVGCGNATSSTDDEILACMRQQPWETISTAVSRIPPSPGGSPVRTTPPFFPLVDNKTVFSAQTYLSLSQSGQFAKIPYLHGHNDFEQGYYVIPAYTQGRNVTEEQAAQFLLESFVCPHSYTARQRVKAKVPTWVYRYFGEWENTKLYEGSGAYHGSELHMIFGGSEDVSGLPASKEQKETAKIAQKAVAAFAEDPKKGLEKLGWPRFDPEKKTWAEIAKGNRAGVTFVRAGVYDGGCGDVVMGALSGSP